MAIRSQFLILLLAVPACAQSGGNPVNVSIQNPSFTQGTAGWNFGASTGVTQKDCDGNALSAPAAYAGYNNSFSQTLTVSPSDLQHNTDGVYTLQMDTRNCFPNYPGYFVAKISFGTQELCSLDGWGIRTFQHFTFTCGGPFYLVADKSLSCDPLPCTGGPPQGSEKFVITFSGYGWPTLVRNFSLTFTSQ